MTSNSRSSLYLILALIVCALLILPYIIPQAGEKIQRGEESNTQSSPRRVKPTIASLAEVPPARDSSSVRKEESKRKLEEIEKLLD